MDQNTAFTQADRKIRNILSWWGNAIDAVEHFNEKIPLSTWEEIKLWWMLRGMDKWYTKEYNKLTDMREDLNTMLFGTFNSAEKVGVQEFLLKCEDTTEYVDQIGEAVSRRFQRIERLLHDILRRRNGHINKDGF